MKVCIFGTYERQYDRNQILMQSLRSQNILFTECHSPLWGDQEHKTHLVSSPLALVSQGLRLSRALISLVFRRLQIHSSDFDLILVPYLGHIDVLLARILFPRKKIVFDAFISLHGTLVKDRKKFSENGIAAKLIKVLDRLATKSADVVLMDTLTHAETYASQTETPIEKFKRVFVGANPKIYYTDKTTGPEPHHPYRVFFYGKFSPLHGIPTILRAWKILSKSNPGKFRFDLVGDGQTREDVMRLAQELEIPELTMTRWMSPDELRCSMQASQVCMGIFGESSKAFSVIPNKVYQAMACGTPIITRDSPAAREFLVSGKNAILVADPTPEKLADEINRLVDNSSQRISISQAALQSIRDRGTPESIGKALVSDLSMRNA